METGSFKSKESSTVSIFRDKLIFLFRAAQRLDLVRDKKTLS